MKYARFGPMACQKCSHGLFSTRVVWVKTKEGRHALNLCDACEKKGATN